jgi:hypothetical protein
MPKMANVYRITFHRQPYANEAYTWQTSEQVEVTSMHQDNAVRLARASLGIDAGADADRWVVKECLNAGAWNKVFK